MTGGSNPSAMQVLTSGFFSVNFLKFGESGELLPENYT
jgi:hypothetical protein